MQCYTQCFQNLLRRQDSGSSTQAWAFFRERPETSGGEARMELDARGLDRKLSCLPYVMEALALCIDLRGKREHGPALSSRPRRPWRWVHPLVLPRPYSIHAYWPSWDLRKFLHEYWVSAGVSSRKFLLKYLSVERYGSRIGITSSNL